MLLSNTDIVECRGGRETALAGDREIHTYVSFGFQHANLNRWIWEHCQERELGENLRQRKLLFRNRRMRSLRRISTSREVANFPPVLAYKKRLFYGGCTRKMYGKRGGARSPPLVHCNSSYVRQTYRWIRRLVWRTFCVDGWRTDFTRLQVECAAFFSLEDLRCSRHRLQRDET